MKLAFAVGEPSPIVAFNVPFLNVRCAPFKMPLLIAPELSVSVLSFRSIAASSVKAIFSENVTSSESMTFCAPSLSRATSAFALDAAKTASGFSATERTSYTVLSPSVVCTTP